MRVSEKAGYAFAAAAILASGSFLVPYRLIYPKVYATHPLVFNLYASMGIFLAHWLAQAFLPLNPDFVHNGSSHFHFSRLGVVAGVLLAFGLAFNFASTARIGMALTQAISAGAAVVSSYLWATVVFQEAPRILWLSILGIILIVTGITSISLSRQTTPSSEAKLARRSRSRLRYSEISPGLEESKEEDRPKFSFEGEEILFGGSHPRGTRLEEGQQGSVTESLLVELHRQAVLIDTRKYLFGVTCAAVSGLVGGSVLAPLHYVPDREKGLAFLPSFSLAALLCAPIILLLYLLNPFGRQKDFPLTFFTETCSLSMISGIIWSIGNICAIGAIDRLGYGIAMPLTQLSVVIAALWGFVCFGEFTNEDGKTTSRGEGFCFAVGAALVIIGGIFLAGSK